MNSRAPKSLSSVLLFVSLVVCGPLRADIILSQGVTYTQNFDTLAFSPDGTTASTLPDSPNGWTFTEQGNSQNNLYSIGNGSSAAGDTYSFGSTGSTERAFGSQNNNSPTRRQDLGVRFQSSILNTQPFTKAIITYTGEQWRLGATGRLDKLDFQVSTNATSITNGTWTDFDSLDFAAPVTTGTLGALDGNAAANRTLLSVKIALPANVSPGQTFWIRWNGFDASGVDDGLAIDDFSIRAIPEPPSILALGGVIAVVVACARRRRKAILLPAETASA